MRTKGLCGVLAAAIFVLATARSAGTARPVEPAPAGRAPALAQLIGQKLVVRMSGTAPSAALLARARGGQIGGVILHGENFRSSAGLRAITGSLQRAAAAGGQPPLLIAVDQEGGPVKTVPWIPPTWSPAQLGRAESDGAALAQGQKTGAALRALGINTDFAPVVDVPASPASFLYRQGRTWSFDARTTARLAGWFAAGLGDGAAIATAKHFPGLGLSSRNTDRFVARIRTTKAALAPGLRPYRTAIAQGVPLIMLSNAVYTAYDPGNAAGWSAAVAKLLRSTLGFRGVTITDSLDAAAHARHVGAAPLAIRASNAGTDLLLLTASESGSRGVYQALVRGSRRLDRTRLLASYRRIVALKRRLQP